MKKAFMLLIVNVPSLVFGSIAAYMALKGVDGWGWFLFVAILIGHTLRSEP